MNREEFLRLAADGYNRIPLSFETLADFDTPLSIYLKLADAPNSYLLESVQGGEKWGRYSIIGLPCRTVLRVYDHQVRISIDGMETERFDCADPLAFVEEFKARYQVPTVPGLPRFDGGLVGYFGYDCVRYVEKRLATCPNPDPLGNPDILLMVSDAVVVFDNLAGKIHAIVLGDPSEEMPTSAARHVWRSCWSVYASRSPRVAASTSRRPRVVSRRFVPASPARTMKTR